MTFRWIRTGGGVVSQCQGCGWSYRSAEEAATLYAQRSHAMNGCPAIPTDPRLNVAHRSAVARLLMAGQPIATRRPTQ